MAILIQEADVVRFGKSLPEVMRRPRLQGTAVAHQPFDRISPLGAGKLLALGLLAIDDRHRQLGLREVLVDPEHLQRFFLRLLGGLVRGMPFLPEKLRRAEEQPRDLLPPDDIRPLIDENRQVAPRVDPLRVHGADDQVRDR